MGGGARLWGLVGLPQTNTNSKYGGSESLALSHTFPEGIGRVAFILVKQHKLGELRAWARSSALKADPATGEAPGRGTLIRGFLFPGWGWKPTHSGIYPTKWYKVCVCVGGRRERGGFLGGIETQSRWREEKIKTSTSKA